MTITVIPDDANALEFDIFVAKPYLLMVSLDARWCWSLPHKDCYVTSDATFIINR